VSAATSRIPRDRDPATRENARGSDSPGWIAAALGIVGIDR